LIPNLWNNMWKSQSLDDWTQRNVETKYDRVEDQNGTREINEYYSTNVC
jgi:hypothetical protein